MLLTITTTHNPATDLGFLLHKNPGIVHERELPVGNAIMFFPEATEERCTFALHLEVDPISLVRGRNSNSGLLDQYVNDRPYAASSFMSVAIARALNTTMSGRSKERQSLADSTLPFDVTVTPLATRGREGIVEDLFSPLGYEVKTTSYLVDEKHPEWGDSPYVTLRLTGNLLLKDLLTHLYVLIPVLDNSKHYYIGDDEVEKLLAKGEGWLDDHPEKEFIVNRYLTRRRPLVREALARLSDTNTDGDFETETRNGAEATLEKPIRLNDQRMNAVVEELVASGATSVADLGCGEGRLLRELLRKKQFVNIIGVDASTRSLEWAEKRLKVDEMSDHQRDRLKLLQGALTYRDQRLDGCQAVALVEVIEHIDEDRIPAVERAIFEYMQPGTVVVTTPNREYNALFKNMVDGALRHGDHRFEWTRIEFRNWADCVVSKFAYEVEFKSIGEEDKDFGSPTQMAIFHRKEESA